jgi:hypothetical protein
MCKPLATEGETLILGFEFPVLKDKFEEQHERQLLVAETMSELLDKRCRVRCVVSGDYVAPAPSPEEAPAGSNENNREAFYALAEELGAQVQEE